jgi:hypothetical protein
MGGIFRTRTIIKNFRFFPFPLHIYFFLNILLAIGIYRASLKKVGLANPSLFRFYSGAVELQENYWYFHNIEFIVVILSMIYFLGSEQCPRYL